MLKSLAECIKCGEILFRLCGFQIYPNNQEPVLCWGFQNQYKPSIIWVYRRMYLFFCGRTDSDSFSLCKHVRVFVWLSLVCVLSTTASRLAKKREFTGVTNHQSQHGRIVSVWPSLPPPFPCVLCIYVLVCTGCFHIWSLDCVSLCAHSHALRILSPLPVRPDPNLLFFLLLLSLSLHFL